MLVENDRELANQSKTNANAENIQHNNKMKHLKRKGTHNPFANEFSNEISFDFDPNNDLSKWDNGP